ncbi:hypothetical protein LEP1GSC058_1193 [Leptospira fainei serovar Hurstbridge str. BUT 6]|uniref:Uncharacterized protein n=1 Tax=Leptospira fainei serovar Hurstbridge str. BUT 6 TaxID=1193011 RepID=S3W842_9LEPT|nr:hypothetical protein [Leptospira fainei]EPG76232.1 hypothetical protein LEP1GSC058_1193 [Leptospira fainei serovar Hurstbridge str. BUT 6]
MEKEIQSIRVRTRSTRILSGIFGNEDQELIRLENSLVRAISELRDKELNQIRLPDNFEVRLQNMLKDVKVDEENLWDKITRNLIWNRSFQYSLTASLAVLVLAVAVGRFSSPSNTLSAERSGTLSLGNDREFIDLPSSAKIGQNTDSVRLLEVAKNPESRKVLESLHLYFIEKGDSRTAEEIRAIMELTAAK